MVTPVASGRSIGFVLLRGRSRDQVGNSDESTNTNDRLSAPRYTSHLTVEDAVRLARKEFHGIASIRPFQDSWTQTRRCGRRAHEHDHPEPHHEDTGVQCRSSPVTPSYTLSKPARGGGAPSTPRDPTRTTKDTGRPVTVISLTSYDLLAPKLTWSFS